MKSIFYTFSILIIINLASCTTAKELIYFQDKKAAKVTPTVNIPTTVIPSHIMAVGDLVGVNINTPLQTSAQILNSKEGIGSLQVKGDSTIEIPILGNIKVAGLTLLDARDTVYKRAKIYFNEPYVNFQLISYKITVLGEVRSPGIKSLPSEKASLIDAIAYGGDLTEFGNRSSIKVLRGDSVYYLDITDYKVMQSMGFYLQSNDVVYVEPSKKKVFMANLASTISVTSLAALLVSLTNTVILLNK